jgi:hypothetical protein
VLAAVRDDDDAKTLSKFEIDAAAHNVCGQRHIVRESNRSSGKGLKAGNRS